jgi:hypothetical protein
MTAQLAFSASALTDQRIPQTLVVTEIRTSVNFAFARISGLTCADRCWEGSLISYGFITKHDI